MAIVPLPLLRRQARALLHHLLEHGDVVGRDTAGRTIIQLAVDDWVLETLMTFDADAAELEDGREPDAIEEDGPPVVVELVRPKWSSDGGPWRRPGRLSPWHAGQRSSSRCIARWSRASPWTRRTSSA